MIHFLRGELGEHRQADAGVSVMLRIGQRTGAARRLAPRITRLLVDGYRIMRFRIHTILDEVIYQLIAPFDLLGFDHVEMEYMPIARYFVRQIKVSTTLQTGRVARGPFTPLVVILVDVFQLGAENAGVQIVETTVEAEAMDVPGIGAVIAQLANSRVEVGVVRDEGAAVAKRAKVLLNDEAGGGGVAQFG